LYKETTNLFSDHDRGLGTVNLSPLQESIIATKFKKAYLSEDYENYILFYFGNIIEAFKNIDYALVYSMGPLFTLAVVKKGMIGNLMEDVPEIYYAERSFPYNLSNLDNMNTTIAKRQSINAIITMPPIP